MLRLTTLAVVLSAIVMASVGLASPFPARGATASVSIVDGSFGPTALTIAVGDTVTWTNNDDSPHTVSAPNGAFDSGNIDPGGSFTFTFAEAGTYGYLCRYHDEMQATIIVTPSSDEGASEVAAANQSPGGGSASGDQPDTAVPAPRGATVWMPGLLIGLGLVAFAVAVVPSGTGAQRAARVTPRSGGWRR